MGIVVSGRWGGLGIEGGVVIITGRWGVGIVVVGQHWGWGWSHQHWGDGDKGVVGIVDAGRWWGGCRGGHRHWMMLEMGVVVALLTTLGMVMGGGGCQTMLGMGVVVSPSTGDGRCGRHWGWEWSCCRRRRWGWSSSSLLDNAGDGCRGIVVVVGIGGHIDDVDGGVVVVVWWPSTLVVGVAGE